MHSAQVLEMLVQMQCPRSVQVLQEMIRIQEGVTEQLCNTVVSRSVLVIKFQRAKSYICADTDLMCLRFRPEKNGVLSWLGRSFAT